MSARSRKILMMPGMTSSTTCGFELISAEYTGADRLAAWKARWGINRMAYRIKPGLYALGGPSASSPVFASANYKLSFDALRTNLKGISAWLLVLDTKGINVWCAAGKGTFGTLELARSIRESGLEKLVNHRSVTLPQLGAPGVSAHRVKAYTGFSITYGPVRAEDIPEFIASGCKASPEMRKVRFGFAERIVLAPVQLTQFGRYLVPASVILLLFGLKADSLLTAGALLAGTVLVPALLPWLPGRSFAVKSAAAGLATTTVLSAFLPMPIYQFCARGLIYSAAASFIGLDFTGASTYTSLSGVKKEMRAALPAQALALLAGLLLLLFGRFL